MITRLIDYTFEIDEETATAFRWQYGVNQWPVQARFFVACRAEQKDKNQRCTAHLKNIVVNAVSHAVPAEYGESGKESVACADETADAAADRICQRYLASH